MHAHSMKMDHKNANRNMFDLMRSCAHAHPPPMHARSMKMDHKNENYNMFDLIAYRIKFVEHPHAGGSARRSTGGRAGALV